MSFPCALFSSSSDKCKPEALVQEILQCSTLPKPKVIDSAIQGYEWSFETKYYSATIHLCTTQSRTIGSQEFANSLQAFIHYFDPNESRSFELTKAWVPYLEHIEPSVQILVCDTSRNTDDVGRKQALEWCIDNGFELVELNPEKDSEDEEDDFAETTGIPRIIQALHAHTWPNMEVKENPAIQSPYVRQLMKEQHSINQRQDISSSDSQTTSSSNENNYSSKSTNSLNPSSRDLEHQNLSSDLNSNSSMPNCLNTDSQHNHKVNSNSNSAVESEDSSQFDNLDWTAFMGAEGEAEEQEFNVEEFEQLFKNLKVMKEKADNMPLDERKKYAERVAVSFWKAIGGDEDEIAGIEDDSD